MCVCMCAFVAIKFTISCIAHNNHMVSQTKKYVNIFSRIIHKRRMFTINPYPLVEKKTIGPYGRQSDSHFNHSVQYVCKQSDNFFAFVIVFYLRINGQEARFSKNHSKGISVLIYIHFYLNHINFFMF